ncbi:MAG: heparinase II/III family protein [Candidatus Latescibacteria bacterium]|nr:heparinase II/III family protein [Candidatus Latescibacterota bacterium]
MKSVVVFLITAISIGLTGYPCYADIVLEPFSYQEDFETRELSAWASYPLWQDTAYDQNFRVNTIVPGDPNISVVQYVTPYTNVDNYAGAQKEFDIYLVPGSKISLRYYLKTNLNSEFFKVRLGAGPDKKVDYTISNPPTNRWEWITVSFEDFVRENPRLAGYNRIKVNALAVLAKFPDADPTMPIYLGLDDVTVKGAQAMAFKFKEPKMFKLSEWKQYIPDRHYLKGETLNLEGEWPLDADRVILKLRLFTEESGKVLYTGDLKKKGDLWNTSFKLSYPEGLYGATLEAFKGDKKLSETEFTIVIVPQIAAGNHPRLWFDNEKKQWIVNRLKSDRFKWVADDFTTKAKEEREKTPIDSIVFDIDQFPDENWIPTLTAWSSGKIHVWRAGVLYNALAYTFNGDIEAGNYTKDLMVKISEFPYWLHPWMIKRGRNIYYPVGELGMDLAIGYDLVYDLMDDNERKLVRSALMKNIVLGCHKGYVEDDLVTSNSSNWVAHITGGSLMCQTAMYNDGPDVVQLEPYFTGALLKDYELVHNTIDRDGAYGEGYGYYNFTMFSWSQSLPVLENVFNIDMSARIHRSYNELIWAGIIKNKETFYFGDSGGNLRPLNNWAWLLPKYKDPLLGWFYNFMRDQSSSIRQRSLNDVMYETEDVPQKDPFDQNPVKVFKDVGTTVFKSGWEPDDFVFVMRTGPFVNHQHIDQGSFWLSDRGSLFIEERHGSSYYTCPLYQSHYIQPIGHSTILIDGNHQSQRVGDLLYHVDGFDDYAFIYHFLDGRETAFTSGDIGRLYWGKVKNMRRNVLYLKPRTLLMLDTVVPAEKNVDVTLLYQTMSLESIIADNNRSTITIDKKDKLIEDPNKYRGEVTRAVSVPTDRNTLNILHVWPERREVKSVETPHYLNTLLNQRPLEREGMLTVNARTSGKPLVIANLLTTTTGEEPDVTYDCGDGYILGMSDNTPFCFSTRPGEMFQCNDFTTDALAVRPTTQTLFVALCTKFTNDKGFSLDSDRQITFEMSYTKPDYVSVMKYCVAEESAVKIGVPKPLENASINGMLLESSAITGNRRLITVTLPAGEGEIQLSMIK